MINAHAFFKNAGADTHKGNSVTVSRVHVGLDFENKSREIFVARLYHCTILQHSWLWLRRQFQEFFQEALHTKVGHRTAEEHRGQLACINLLHIKFIACHIQQLDIIAKVFV